MRHLRAASVAGLAILMAAGCTAAGVEADPVAAEDPDTSSEDGEAEPEGPDPEPDPAPDPALEPEPEPEPVPEPLDPLEGLALELVVDGLDQPVDAAALPDGRLLVVERTGTVRLVEDGQLAGEPFLDLTGVVNANSLEQGLLGLAPHPDFPADPRVFLFHSLPSNDNVLVSYRVAGDGNALDPGSRSELLVVDKEPDKVRHNGGQLVFAPDGTLFVAVGDAARASVNGQDPATLPASMLRIDVDAGDPYAVPPDNPFADALDGAPEVWWFGLRNPWRFSIDEQSGLAYVADVGQEDVEEVNVVPFDEPGHNFGWPLFEGTDRFYSGEPRVPVTDPVLEARHGTDQACSITGGFVYRGAAVPELDGHYFYADWCRGWIRSFRYEGGEVADEQDWSDQLGAQMVSSFALDANGELLVLDMGDHTVKRIVPVRAGS